ncbi:MAG: hypothetical protein E6Q33_01185 [Neisseriales bacterium]|nr:MAG: hypothetical protein E6Q33_01185 [Neisseriales bacterium]
MQQSLKGFIPLINQYLLTAIYDKNCKIVACSELSANSVGLTSRHDAIGLSYQDIRDIKLMRKIFGNSHNSIFYEKIFENAMKVHAIQQAVIRKNEIINYLDYLPYNEKFVPYLVTCVPIICDNNQVVGIQSYTKKCSYLTILSRNQIIKNMLSINSENKNTETTAYSLNLTKREHEITFLLANDLSIDEIYEALGTTRSTISNIIAAKLCPKFGLFGSRTKLLSKVAKERGYHKLIPESLSAPCVIVLDEDAPI